MKKQRPYVIVLLWTILVAGLLCLIVWKTVEEDKIESIPAFVQNHPDYVIYGAVVFLVTGIAAVIILWRQGRELKQLAKAVHELANGNKEIQKLSLHGTDMRRIWNSLLEMQKNINRTNYSKRQTLEACSRFIPKHIEKILGKNSIEEVNSGDMVQLWGTAAVVSSVSPMDMQRTGADDRNQFIRLLEKHQEEEKGFFVSGNCSLNRLKILFLDESANAIEFGTAFMNEFHEMAHLEWLRTCILLYYSRYVYGVAGTNQQSFPFLLSEEMKELEKYAAWFRNLGLSLVIAENVKQRKQAEYELRYIGYIKMSEEEKIDLYEVLDACMPKERREKLRTNACFQKALELFYQHDFYLARSTFSEVLKENPKDALAKWYLFTCEKYLNEVCTKEDVCRLHPDR
uniref:hypothetical protein n=1 Tax=Agathobacter sp. TaxID=2021311 RepID=UPI004055C991